MARKLTDLSIAPLAVSLACGGTAATAPPLSNGGGASLDGLHAVDWSDREYTVTAYQADDEPVTYRVQGGFSSNVPGADPEADGIGVDGPAYGDLTGDGLDEAALTFTEILHGHSGYDWVTVYSGTAAAPRELGTILGGDRGDGGIAGVAVREGALWLERNGTTGGACCPEYIDVERWTWDGSELTEDETARTRRAVPEVRR